MEGESHGILLLLILGLLLIEAQAAIDGGSCSYLLRLRQLLIEAQTAIDESPAAID